MSKLTDQEFLKSNQYKNASNLTDRVNIHQKYSTNPYNFHRWAFDQYKLKDKLRVLEIGCGSGEIWKINKDRIPTFKQLVLSDLSIGMIKTVKSDLHDILPKNTQYEVFDVQNIPLDSESFDVVMANHMLYHVPDVMKAINEIHRILVPGGVFYGSTNGKDHMIELDKLMNNYNDYYKDIHYDRLEFLLEDAPEKVQMFSSSKVLRFEDSLRITNATDLMLYQVSRSYNIDSLHKDSGKKALTNYFSEIIKQNGFIKITKDAGLVIAIK